MEVLLVSAGIALAILFGQSSGPEEAVVLLPGVNGHVGTVIVERDGKTTTLNTAYAATRAQGRTITSSEPFNPDEVRRDFGAALAAIPARPTSFLLYFVTGTDELTDESKGEMQRVLDELRRRPAPDILVIGHTDRVGGDAENDSLSLQRAQRMREEMLSLGIPPARIRAAGRGERDPLVPTADGVEEPRNRRVEISVR